MYMEADCWTSDDRGEGMRVVSGDQDDMDEVLSQPLVNDAAALQAEVQDQNTVFPRIKASS